MLYVVRESVKSVCTLALCDVSLYVQSTGVGSCGPVVYSRALILLLSCQKVTDVACICSVMTDDNGLYVAEVGRAVIACN